ncbi:hypothetical protein Droror1_Dr00003376 [Drosera rotundifolia]
MFILLHSQALCWSSIMKNSSGYKNNQKRVEPGYFCLLKEMGVCVQVYDDEPSSIIAYAPAIRDYQTRILNDVETDKEGSRSSSPRALFGSWNSMEHDLHSRVSFVDDGLLAKVKFTVTSYYAKRFEELRKICYLSELDFIWSVSGCKKSVAQGGKDNLFSTESLDDRFLVKQVTNTELESFIEFAPAYFEHLTGALLSQCPTCLQKIMGIYQVTTKQLKGREESKWDIVVMENVWFDHCNVTHVRPQRLLWIRFQ